MSFAQTTASCNTLDAHGAVKPYVTLTFQLIGVPNAADYSFASDAFTATSDSSGALSVALAQGCTYRMRRGTYGRWVNFTAANSSTMQLPDILGPDASPAPPSAGAVTDVLLDSASIVTSGIAYLNSSAIHIGLSPVLAVSGNALGRSINMNDGSGSDGGNIWMDQGRLYLTTSGYGFWLGTQDNQSATLFCDDAGAGIRFVENSRVDQHMQGGNIAMNDATGTGGGTIYLDGGYLSMDTTGCGLQADGFGNIGVSAYSLKMQGAFIDFGSGAGVSPADTGGLELDAANGVSFLLSADGYIAASHMMQAGGGMDLQGTTLWFDQDNGSTSAMSGDSSGNVTLAMQSGSTFSITNLPTSDPHVAGAIWNNGGQLMISAG